MTDKAPQYGTIEEIRSDRQQRVVTDEGSTYWLTPGWDAVKGGKVGDRVILHWRQVRNSYLWVGELAPVDGATVRAKLDTLAAAAASLAVRTHADAGDFNREEAKEWWASLCHLYGLVLAVEEAGIAMNMWRERERVLGSQADRALARPQDRIISRLDRA